MAGQPVGPRVGGADEEDRLLAGLAYVFTPLLPGVLLLVEEKRQRRIIRLHCVQALAWGVVFYLIVGFLSRFLVGLCIWSLGLIAEVYWGYNAYRGKDVTIPLISQFVKGQGWV